ncbi:MAG: proprotein convertase P-domain-containing protein [Polyangia bacterium]|jgi:hypothetical protein|nr:proprotein convertase P-domain-containing protein [Polyangia bacterium]
MKTFAKQRVVGLLTLCLCLGVAEGGCTGSNDPSIPEYSNPFTDTGEGGKEDTAYYNLRGVELHVTLEADVVADSWRIFDAPADLAQFAVTYLREKEDFYVELLAEDTATPDRVEWLVNGEWLTKTQAEAVDRGLLKRWRLRDVNAVVLDRDAETIAVGQTFQPPVPNKPYTVMADAGSKCATEDGHISLDQSIYWYLWNPDKSTCDLETQKMTVTVTEVLAGGFATYPEYDRLWEDGVLTVAVFWAKLDDGDVADDYNWDNFKKFGTWLTEGGFVEQPDAAMGKRFSKQLGEKSIVVDVYGPDVFHSVADYSRLQNWQRAVNEHEVVLYNGHSVLGTGMAFEEITYPSHYQIFQIASCLSYEYYVRPILEGKGGWENVDVISNVEPTYYHENLPLVGAMLAKLFWGFEHDGQASWRDIMEAVSRKLYHSRFGVSGARGNCFSPEGNLCVTGTCVDHTDENACNAASCVWLMCPAGLTCDEADICVSTAESSCLGHTDATSCNAISGCQWAACPDHLTCEQADTCVPVAVTPTEQTFESTTAVAIPDNDPAGASSAIDVPGSLTIGSLKVRLDVSHSYTGDLKIVLAHGGLEHVLWDRAGGSGDDIKNTFEVTTFDGQSATGAWTLSIVDNASIDEGRLNSWALIVTPAE